MPAKSAIEKANSFHWTPRREAFCLHYVVCNEGNQAAIEAGYKPTTAKSSACEILKFPEVQERISTLRAKIESDLIMGVAERQEHLSAIGRKHKDARVKIQAIAELNKMGGNYAPVKQELTGKDGEPIEVNLDVRAKLLTLIDSAAARIRTPQDSQLAIREGCSANPLRLEGAGAEQPATPAD